MTMRLHPETRLDDTLVERELTLHDDIPGLLWTPTARPDAGLPLLLMGHPGGLPAMRERLTQRARHAAALGFATAALEVPGAGARPALPEIDAARTELRAALTAGERPSDDVVDRLVLPLVEQSVPEHRSLVDELLARPGFSGAVGVSGGITAVGVRLAAVEPRLRAVSLFAGSWLPRSTYDDARRTTIPVHVLLQWDDHGNDRQAALELYDAFGSAEKTMQVNLGGHTGIPPYAADDAGRFLLRHVR
jgi:hypothetical protein